MNKSTTYAGLDLAGTPLSTVEISAKSRVSRLWMQVAAVSLAAPFLGLLFFIYSGTDIYPALACALAPFVMAIFPLHFHEKCEDLESANAERSRFALDAAERHALLREYLRRMPVPRVLTKKEASAFLEYAREVEQKNAEKRAIDDFLQRLTEISSADSDGKSGDA